MWHKNPAEKGRNKFSSRRKEIKFANIFACVAVRKGPVRILLKMIK